jgi:hypothetical protein
MKKVFLYVSIGITLLAIPITVFLVSKNQEIRKKAAPASSLSLVPATIIKRVGETFTLEVKLNTAGNQIMTVQLGIVYDPTKLKAEDITNGSLAPTIRVSGRAEVSGKATITVGARDTATPINGTGTIAILTMRALTASSGPVSINFSPHPDTQANALNEENNAIVGLQGANITILNADGTQGSAAATTLTQIEATMSATLTPIPTITAESTTSGQASPSALLIESPILNEDVSSTQPEIRGKGVPGSSITVIIHSDPITDTVTVDANGNWVYTPSTPLSPGTHTVEAMYTDPATGQTQTKTITFVVTGTQSSTEVSTDSAMPVSGSTHMTILLISLGIFLLGMGIVLPVYVR